MASYAQSQPLQFNPFVPQTDVQLQERLGQENLQAQTAVGIQKEQSYQENAQKIQGLYDNVIGIQLVKDSDKAYLNQAVDSLKNDMQSIAKADLSKQQIFNQAGSIAAKIYNDPKIL